MTDTQARADLKPCPFCGGDARIAFGYDHEWDYRPEEEHYFAECNPCDARGKSFSCVGPKITDAMRNEAKSKAAFAWNTRAALEEVRPVVPDGLEKISRRIAQTFQIEGDWPWEYVYTEIKDCLASSHRTPQEIRNEALQEAIDIIKKRMPKSLKVSENSDIYEAHDFAVSMCLAILISLKKIKGDS